MLKKYLLCISILLSATAFAEEAANEECEAAVDAASRINPNDNKNCDYSNTGLNGVLHRAFAKKPEATDKQVESIDKKTASDKSDKVVNEVLPTAKSPSPNEFPSMQQLQVLRYSLIKKAAGECSKGFILEGERYLSTTSGGINLELIYHCL